MARRGALFTTAEAADLAEAPPGAIEKAIEEGIVDVRKAPARKAGARRRRLLSAEGVYYVAFLRRCDLHFSSGAEAAPLGSLQRHASSPPPQRPVADFRRY